VADPLALLALTLFWPLFPASMAFNALADRLRLPMLRALVSCAWPLAGVLLLPAAGPREALAALPVPLPASLLPAVALFTALFYAWRSLTVNDLSRWAAMMCTSALALLWLPWSAGARPADLAAAALAFGSACAVLHVVARALFRRVGSDYLGNGRLGAAHPRLAAMLAVSVLAALGAPPFPGFFSMLFIAAHIPWWGAVGTAAVWWLWSWSGARLWQRAYFGASAAAAQGRDLGTSTCLLAGALALLISIAAYAWSTTWMH
jgi:formate hydrogenlyase subunit 3/multisubunit Na+/H+ antiporter MnhD subunit